MRHVIFSTLFLLTASFSNLLHADAADLLIKNAWIAEAPPVSKVMVAYMTIKNASPNAIEVISAESDMYSSIEFHETVHENGMARMERYSSLKFPPGSRLEFKPGSLHFMLFNPVKTLKAGDTVTIKLTTKGNTSKAFPVTVKKVQH